ncbi:hypothetical protein CVT24_011415 [Panaeolus cyanescens]|uniref:WSC domain-containing protein n=1 Tax=Panaeolus cyanescens TaxID=181874 RepID=A0A409VG99_9AGAR|nr:hypothetical protein CVT24_011415 [Panaeolus cyanescens]
MRRPWATDWPVFKVDANLNSIWEKKLEEGLLFSMCPVLISWSALTSNAHLPERVVGGCALTHPVHRQYTRGHLGHELYNDITDQHGIWGCMTIDQSSSSSIPALAPAPVGWRYRGCYEDTPLRILDGTFYADSASMTVNSCISRCEADGLRYAGLEIGDQCFCGNNLKSGAVLRPEGECSMPCAGSGNFSSMPVVVLLLTKQCTANQRCGEVWRLNIYQATEPTPSSSPISTRPPSPSAPLSPPTPPPPPSPTPTPPSITPSGSSTFILSSNLSTDTVSTSGTSQSLTTRSSIGSMSQSFISKPSSSESSSGMTYPTPLNTVFTPSDSGSTSTADTLSTGAVAGIAVSVAVVVIILVAFLTSRILKSKRQRQATTRNGE